MQKADMNREAAPTGIFQKMHDNLRRDLLEDGDGDGSVAALCLLDEFARAEQSNPNLLADFRVLASAASCPEILADATDLAMRLVQADIHPDVVGATEKRRDRLRRQAVEANHAARGKPGMGRLEIDAPIGGGI